MYNTNQMFEGVDITTLVWVGDVRFTLNEILEGKKDVKESHQVYMTRIIVATGVNLNRYDSYLFKMSDRYHMS